MKKIDLSIIIPAYNEEKYLDTTLKTLTDVLNKISKELNYSYEIIVCDNDSSDSTVDIAKKYGAKIAHEKIHNIAKVRNSGARAASGETLIFLDADSTVNYELFYAALNEINKPKIKIISCNIKLNTYPSLASRGIWFFNKFARLFKSGASIYVCIKRSTFLEVGGFNEKYFAFEEFELFRTIKKHYGFNAVKVLRESVVTSSRKFEGNKDVLGFILMLAIAPFDKTLGTNKNELTFWYGNTNLIPKYKMVIFWYVFSLLVFHLYFQYIGSDLLNYSPLITPFIFALIFIFLISKKVQLIPALLIILFTLLIEAFSLRTTFPFGDYFYTIPYRDFSFFEVPLYIGVAWFLILGSVSSLIRSKWFSVVLVIGIDLFLERYAELNNIWLWSSTTNFEKIFIAPLSNYIAWGVLAYLLHPYLRRLDLDRRLSFLTLFLIVGHVLTSLMFSLF